MSNSLERFVQIDIDDMFVGQNGTRIGKIGKTCFLLFYVAFIKIYRCRLNDRISRKMGQLCSRPPLCYRILGKIIWNIRCEILQKNLFFTFYQAMTLSGKVTNILSKMQKNFGGFPICGVINGQLYLKTLKLYANI